MDEKIVTALIAAAVSFVLSLIGYLGTVRQLKSQQDRLEKELEARRTDRLYDLRLKHYPKYFEITAALFRSGLVGESRVQAYKEARDKIREWRRGEPMLVLSKAALASILELEDALKKKPHNTATLEYSLVQMEKIWRLRLRSQSSLRRDLGLLFNDSNEHDLYALRKSPINHAKDNYIEDMKSESRFQEE